MTRKILIDCNWGPDTSLALLCALAMPELEVEGISCIYEPFPVETSVRNIGKLLALAGRSDIRYCRGSAKALLSESPPFRAVWDLGNLPDAQIKPVEAEAPDFLWRRTLENPGLDLVTLGPLTNAARMLLAHPDVAGLLGQIVIMGGAHAWGNVTPKAEFNIFSDPYAAHLVFDSSIPVVMVGLDAASECKELPQDFVASSLAGPSRNFVALALESISEHCEKPCKKGGSCLHSVTTVLCEAHPEVFDLVECRTDVELKGKFTFGQTVCDFTGVSRKPHNAKVAMHIKEQPYRKLLCKTLASI